MKLLSELAKKLKKVEKAGDAHVWFTISMMMTAASNDSMLVILILKVMM